SSFVVRPASRAALRESPTPLVFVSAGEWDPDTRTGMTEWASMFPEKGFTCIQTDLTMPESPPADSAALMHHFETQLRSDIRLAMSAFPPVIFARASACLIAQAYISSNPASGLFLVSPPPTNAAVSERGLLPTPLEEFDFEPRFPIAVMAPPAEMDVLARDSRLAADAGVDRLAVHSVDGQEAFAAAETWLDELGI
ncbi:hypothetical protein FIBSPDRAFT_670129, partial [Athelia psychrophila]